MLHVALAKTGIVSLLKRELTLDIHSVLPYQGHQRIAVKTYCLCHRDMPARSPQAAVGGLDLEGSLKTGPKAALGVTGSPNMGPE